MGRKHTKKKTQYNSGEKVTHHAVLVSRLYFNNINNIIIIIFFLLLVSIISVLVLLSIFIPIVDVGKSGVY